MEQNECSKMHALCASFWRYDKKYVRFSGYTTTQAEALTDLLVQIVSSNIEQQTKTLVTKPQQVCNQII